jgi:hypothetical protein
MLGQIVEQHTTFELCPKPVQERLEQGSSTDGVLVNVGSGYPPRAKDRTFSGAHVEDQQIPQVESKQFGSLIDD